MLITEQYPQIKIIIICSRTKNIISQFVPVNICSVHVTFCCHQAFELDVESNKREFDSCRHRADVPSLMSIVAQADASNIRISSVPNHILSLVH